MIIGYFHRSFLCCWLIIFTLNVLPGSGADCTGKVYASLSVTGAYTKYNGTNYSVKVNEYATFTCSGNAEDGVEVESTLVVKCTGASSQKIKSSAGTGSVTAKWQSNDNCNFMTSCELECSASTDCDSTETQLYSVEKVSSYEYSAVNCTEESKVSCQAGPLEDNEGNMYYNYWQTFALLSPWGDGLFRASSTCDGATNIVNTSTTSTWIVRSPSDACECSTTFTYREENSLGEICSTASIEKSLTLRNDEVCSRVPAEVIVLWVLFVLIILSVMFTVIIYRKHVKKINKDKPSERQVERMTAMDHLKLAALIEVANDPVVDNTATIPHLAEPKSKPDPIYDDVVETKY